MRLFCTLAPILLLGCASNATNTPRASKADSALARNGTAEVDSRAEGSPHEGGVSTPKSGPEAAPSLLETSECTDAENACTRAILELAKGRALLEHAELSYGAGGTQVEKALTHFESALQLAPNLDAALLEKGRCLLSLGRGKEARPLLSDLATRFPNDAEVQAAWGIALLATGHADLAIEPLTAAVRLDPETPERHGVLGTAVFLLGRLEQAERHYRKAVALDSGNPQFHGDLGTLLVLSGRVDEGKRHLERAVAIAPKRATFRSNLAYAHYVEGNLTQAEELVREALRLDPNLPSAWLNLGLIQAKQGAVDDARLAFETAARLAPDDPRPQQNLEDLKGL